MRRALTVAGLAAALATLGGVSSLALTVVVDAAQQVERAEVRLTFDQPVRITSESLGRELLLRFDRALPPADWERLARQLPDWLAYVSTGYDSLLLVAERDARFQVSASGRSVTVALEPPAPADPESGPAPLDPPAPEGDGDGGRRRLALLDTQLLADSGAVVRARDKLRGLVAADPRDADARTQLGLAEGRLGRWPAAERELLAAEALSPEAETIAEARRELGRELDDHLRADWDWRSTRGGDTRRTARASGRLHVGEDLAVAVETDIRDVEAGAAIRRADGTAAPFRGRREQATLALDGTRDDGDRWRAALHLAEGGAGLAAAYTWRHELGGSTTLGAEWRRPYWETLEGLVDDGRRDRLELRHERPLGADLNLAASLAANRYGVGGLDGAVESVQFAGQLFYTPPWFDRRLGLGYIVDGEYVVDRKTPAAAEGGTFRPLGLVTREVHSLQLEGRFEPWPGLLTNPFVAYTYDRYGQRGPALGLNIRADLPWDAELGGRIGRALSASRDGGGIVTYGGLYLLKRF
ncbi:MAG TPA: hypothetical protein VEH84_10075 [Alphaproteobacteria bacterium]|nr:hypothetical protein [Alphaproteobacteria bacterium]